MKTVLLLGVFTFLGLALGALSGSAAPKEPWTHEYAQVNGLKLHYVQAGKGKTVLFLHGFPEFWYEWRKHIPALAEKGYHTAAFDMRGYNLSEKPANVDDYAMPKLVADVKGMLETVSKGRKAILVAHDWGGVIAWAFAAEHPELLEKLVIINAPHPAIFMRELANNPKQQQASAYMNLFRSPEAEAALSANNYAALVAGVLNGVQPSGSVSDEEKRAYLEAWSRPGALTGGLNYYRAAKIGPPADGQPLPALAVKTKIPVPTLVIWGEKDSALLTSNLDGLDTYVPKLTVRRIPNGSHWVVHEQPELITRMIDAFARDAAVAEAE